jgi:16S rRNA (adenine1518-N6/adenine1519-N6)-dimethyltransferase
MSDSNPHSAALPSLEQVVAQFGLQTKKALGQHFLLDSALCEQIVALAGSLEGIHIIEIGPGPGGLTRALLAARPASITAIEKDRRVLPAIASLAIASQDRLKLQEADALTTDCTQLCPAPRAIIANLPYNISTELLLGWLEQLYTNPNAYQQILIMLQREVGERLVAQPCSKAYGRLSVMAQWLCDVELRMLIPPHAFSPPPKVESVMVQLLPRQTPLAPANMQSMQRVLACAFQQRRKMLRSALKPLGIVDKLAALGIDDSLRPDQLSISAFATLANALPQDG